MKVLHVSPTYYPAFYWGGPILSVYGLNNALARLPGVRLTVLTTDSAGPQLHQSLSVESTSQTRPDHRYEVIYCRRLFGHSVAPQLLARMPALVRNADVVHLTAAYSFPTLPTLVACRLFGKPIVWSPRGALQATSEWAGARRKALKHLWEVSCDKALPRRLSVLHATSAEEATASLARIKRARVAIVPNGVEIPSVLGHRQWRPEGLLRLLFLGRLDPQKGIENLLAAMAVLEGQKVSLEVLGTGEPSYVEKLKSMANGMGLGPRVEFGGFVSGERKVDAFNRADVCVVPSHSESFCMVVAEALAHGVPVVASTCTPWVRVREQGCGAWVDNSPLALADAIRAMRSAPLAEMGRRGRSWMIDEFSWNSVARQMLSLYGSLTAEWGGQRG